MFRSLLAALAAGTALLAPFAAAHAACARLNWSNISLPERRALSPDDLVRIRDVGPSGDDPPSQHLFSFSPDHRSIAFQIRQADPASNSYCLGMVVISLETDAKPRFVDMGGELILRPADDSVYPIKWSGIPSTVTPVWTSDGKSILFLKRTNGVTNVWRASTASTRSSQLTAFSQDVSDFRLIDDRLIIAKLRDDGSAMKEALDREALGGYHFDSRFVPMMSSRPYARVAPARIMRAIDMRTGTVREATAQEVSAFPNSDRTVADPTESPASCTSARRATDNRLPSSWRVEQICPTGAKVVCTQAACSGNIITAWENNDATIVRFLKQEGWARSEWTIYEWNIAADSARKIYSTHALLMDCQPLTFDDIICLRETSLEPRHLARLDLRRNGLSIIANFNPEFSRLDLGRVERLTLRSDAGIEAFADLVLPTNFQAGRRVPVIIVQYQSRGFLRGGTGDEFPIQAFANNGFAVLSMQRPMPVGALNRPRDAIAIDRVSLLDFADRKSVLSVIEKAVAIIVDRGIADPSSIGITGLSDGSSTVQFASLHSELFSAAVVSGCCWEPGQAVSLGPQTAQRYTAIGWPDSSEIAETFWKNMSISRNADRIGFPFLFQMADEEYQMALPSFIALQEKGKPADLFVYPEEHHVKWQPAHRLSSYWRSIDWFNYWLRGIVPAKGRRKVEALRWQSMPRTADRTVQRSVGADMSH